MSDTTYNGWSNYATWRINLECVDGFDPRDHGFHGLSNQDFSDIYDLGQYLKQYVEEFLFANSSGLLVEDYARAFMSDVNWYEIAKHLIAEYAEEVEA